MADPLRIAGWNRRIEVLSSAARLRGRDARMMPRPHCPPTKRSTERHAQIDHPPTLPHGLDMASRMATAYR